MKPLTVNITNTSMSVVAEHKYELKCDSFGSRPEAEILWFKGKIQMKKSREIFNINSTTSILTYTPTVEDDGTTLICRSENPKIPGYSIESAVKISVFCKLITFNNK